MKNKKTILIILLTLIIILSGFILIRIMDSTYSNHIRDLEDSESKETVEQTLKESETDTEEKVEVMPGAIIKVLSYEELSSYLKRKTSSLLVIGQTGCSACERYYPILENISSEYNLEILYIDLKQLDDENYKLFKNSNIIIPSKCSRTGEDITINNGFGTPLTLFIKEEKTYDCIRGFANKEKFLSTLKANNLVN